MIRFSQVRTVSKEQQNHPDTDEEDDGIDIPDTPYHANRNPHHRAAWTSSSATEARQDGSGAHGHDASSPLNEFASCTDSPAGDNIAKPRKTSGKHDQHEETQTDSGGNEEDSSNDSEWTTFMDTVQEKDCPNLSAYLSAKAARETAKENFSKVLEECGEGLRKAMIEEMLQDSVVAIHQEQGERFEAHEADIISTMVSNNDRRKNMLKCMDAADAKWSKTFKRLRGSVEMVEIANSESDEANDPTGSPFEKENAGGGNEPNWDELAEFAPSRDSIQSFLDARSNFQNAEESLERALDDIHAGLQAEVDAIMNVAVEIHNEHESNCIEMEQDIEYNLMENNRRREALQQRLEESAKQAQGVFASLLSRLAMKLY